MSDTLHSLLTAKISKFFKLVRNQEEILPTDGKLNKILSVNFKEFTRQEVNQIENKTENYPDEEWKKQFHAGLKLVLMGNMTTTEVKKDLGIE